APFERIRVTAATPDIEPAWLEQLAPGGVLLAPLALAPGLAFVVRGGVVEGTFHGRLLRPAYFMPLRAEDETGQGESGLLPSPSGLERQPAPWGDALETGRARFQPLPRLQALAFFAWLRGLTIGHQSSGEQPVFGVGDLVEGCLCWFGVRTWHVSGQAGRRLGESLWRSFLDAGGPWPSEFDFLAHPTTPPPAGGGLGGAPQGPRCRQTWRLREERDRPVM